MKTFETPEQAWTSAKDYIVWYLRKLSAWHDAMQSAPIMVGEHEFPRLTDSHGFAAIAITHAADAIAQMEPPA